MKWLCALLVAATLILAFIAMAYGSEPVPTNVRPDDWGYLNFALGVIEQNRKEGSLNNQSTDSPGINDDEDDGYSAFSLWYETDASITWMCVDATIGAAEWIDLVNTVTGGTGHFFWRIFDDSGSTNVTADAFHDLMDMLGGTNITTVAVDGAAGGARDKITINWAADLGDLGDWPLTTRGDLLTMDSVPDPDRLAIGADRTFLKSDGTDPSWQTILELGFFNGTFAESFDALATATTTTVTMSVEKTGTGDLTMVFSDGYTTFDCTPAATIALTAGSDASPTENFIYILQSGKVLVKSTSDWPSAEHIKIAHFVVPSAVFVQANGTYSNQNINDHASSTSTNLGHLSHIAERIRAQSAIYKSGVDLTVTIGGGATVDVAVTAGVVYQMHKHSTPALDTATGDIVLVVNQNGAAYDNVTDLETLTNDSTGTAVKKYFNWVLWGVVNKTGAFCPQMLNLPNGSYNQQASAEADVSGYDVLTLPSAFDTSSATGFLQYRITMSLIGGTWAHVSTVDLRGATPQSVSGGVGLVDTQFADNAFLIFDEGDNTKEIAFQASSITTGNTRTITMADANIDLADVISHAAASNPHGTSFDELADTIVTAVTDDEVLKYSSGNWINNTLVEAGIAPLSHSHAAAAIVSGTLAHERGGLEFDASAVAIGDIITGSGAGTMALVTSTGHSDGDVFTRQGDGSADWEAAAGGGGDVTAAATLVENYIVLGHSDDKGVKTGDIVYSAAASTRKLVGIAGTNLAIGGSDDAAGKLTLGGSDHASPSGDSVVFNAGGTTEIVTVNSTGLHIADSYDLVLDDNGVTTARIISESGTNTDVVITPDGTGDLILDGLKWPQADGTGGYLLKTDGAAQLSWIAAAGTGDVTAASNFGTDNRIITSDGVLKGVQSTSITVAIDEMSNVLTVVGQATNDMFIYGGPDTDAVLSLYGSNAGGSSSGDSINLLADNGLVGTFDASGLDVTGAISASTSLTTPLVIGGTAAGSDLTLQSTSSSSPSGDTILAKTAGVTALTLSGDATPATSTHQLLLGNAMPTDANSSDQFIVAAQGGFTVLATYAAGGTANQTATFRLSRANGTLAVPTAVGSGDRLGTLAFTGHDGGTYRSKCLITAEVDGAVGSNNVPTRLVFWTGTTSIVESFRIESDQDVLVAGTNRIQFSDSSQYVYAPSATQLNVVGGTDIDFMIGAGVEMTLQANLLTLEQGATDSIIDWSTAGHMKLRSGANIRFTTGTSGIGFFSATDVAQQTALTGTLTTMTSFAPGTPDYAVTLGTVGLATDDEMLTLLEVIENLQTRVNELETKMQAYGLLQ